MKSQPARISAASRLAGLGRSLAWLLILPALGAPAVVAGPLMPPSKVPLTFDRLHDEAEFDAALRALVAAHPELLTRTSLGKSTQGRDLWCITVNDPKTGPDRAKPAMYVDGNIHGNEVQAAEVCLYLLWYLTENRDRAPALRKLVEERAFYIVPVVNPDGRAFWFEGPNTTNSGRGPLRPLDEDRDGVADEDGYDDLDGDGQITDMRRKSPDGRFRVSPEDPRLLVEAAPDQAGEYELLGPEGVDNDGDGRVNEDPPGGGDLNRNFPADWQPEHLQGGAGDFTLSFPEARAVAEFVRDHPNIAGVQAFHNAAGMILRGPGHESRRGQYPAGDERVAAAIARAGERMLPGYRSLVIYKDLYPLHGGFITWTYEHLGILSFTNELWNNDQLTGRTDRPAPAEALNRAVGLSDEGAQLFADDRLLFGTQFVPWKPVKHPLYGDIEVGGFVKQSRRVPPPFLLHELCHRNAAFALYHADQLPRVVWGDARVEPLGPASWSLTVAVRNTRPVGTIGEQAARRKLGLPDTLEISGPGLTVVGGGIVTDPDRGLVDLAESGPARLKLEGGVEGHATARVRWFLDGAGEILVRFRSQKGGGLEHKLTLP